MAERRRLIRLSPKTNCLKNVLILNCYDIMNRVKFEGLFAIYDVNICINSFHDILC